MSDHLIDEIQALRRERDGARQEVERLRALLAKLEWSPDWESDNFPGDPRCPVCDVRRSYGGHLTACWLDAELTK